jgi:hypothetical protein
MPEAAQPAKRRPGRPPGVVTVRKVRSDTAVDDAPVDESDPRIGQLCDPNWLSVGYDDGSTYRCENGKIVERVI